MTPTELAEVRTRAVAGAGVQTGPTMEYWKKHETARAPETAPLRCEAPLYAVDEANEVATGGCQRTALRPPKILTGAAWGEADLPSRYPQLSARCAPAG